MGTNFLIVAISSVTAILVAAFTYYTTKQREREADNPATFSFRMIEPYGNEGAAQQAIELEPRKRVLEVMRS